MSRGGPGRGQGRKPMSPDERKRTISVRLPPDVIDWMDERAEQVGQSRAEIVEDALRRRMRSRAP
jgi:metal-responsive CopG/Arc/MetJ family transcriptional regulator